MGPVLHVDRLSASYGPILALEGVSLEVREREVVLLAGANGSGKTTLIRAVAGLVAPAAGTIRFRGERIDGLPAHRVAARGLRVVPEGRLVWPTLTVREHLQIAWHGVAADRRRLIEERISRLFPRLGERWSQAAGTLSGGEQQMLAIARALAGDPSLLLVDELSLGLAPAVVEQLFAAIADINREGVAVLLVEQALRRALEIAGRGYVLETGRLVAQGTAGELRESDVVRKAYLTL
jgi:branched-chain amino acid transport system ATP-binding protein